MQLKFKAVSSLEKVFPDEELNAPLLTRASVLRGEVFSFQLAYWCNYSVDLSIDVDSSLSNIIKIRETALAPCEVPAEEDGDSSDLLRTTPGLYPDPLLPLGKKIRIAPKQWRTIWVTVCVADDEPAGKKTIFCKATASLIHENKSVSTEAAIELDVLPVDLPKQKLIHTEWFHADCIYSFYNVKCWSEKYWDLLDKFLANFSNHGMNMLLTPLWTPPLDTKVGGERPTVQLLGIKKDGDTFKFDFSKLGRWIDLGLKNGIEYFEMAHPFSQWGAECCPKIIVREDEEERKMFGWHISSRSKEYVSFLRQLFPQLLKFLDSKGIKGKCFYHVSDEPKLQHQENYRTCADLIIELVDGAPIIDALSRVEFYANGLVKNPIPSNNHIEAFVAAGVAPLWTYYCISQREEVPNRFFNFPSYRNRVMGVLMYKYDIYGFLHWGYNFWYSQFSIDQKLDPFKSTDAGRAFASGDAFLVYPGEDGPIDSIRNEVMFEALQDLRALRKLESLQGRDATIALIEDGVGYELKMANYPRSAAWLLNLRERVNKAIVELSR
jgi:Glycoside hydrolase 123, catalytic domain